MGGGAQRPLLRARSPSAAARLPTYHCGPSTGPALNGGHNNGGNCCHATSLISSNPAEAHNDQAQFMASSGLEGSPSTRRENCNPETRSYLKLEDSSLPESAIPPGCGAGATLQGCGVPGATSQVPSVGISRCLYNLMSLQRVEAPRETLSAWDTTKAAFQAPEREDSGGLFRDPPSATNARLMGGPVAEETHKAVGGRDSSPPPGEGI